MFHRLELVLVWCLCCWGALAVHTESAEPFSLRLVGGRTRCQGQLQVQISGQEWTGVRPSKVPLWLGDRVCAVLDCGSALVVEVKTVPRTEGVILYPGRCVNASLSSCFDSKVLRSPSSLDLNCSDSVRLVGGRGLCSGSLQIRDWSVNQSWTEVCEGALGHRGAEVLCRELGCGPPLLEGALSPRGQTFHCEGHESALMDCPRNKTRPETCSALQLTCSELRLVEGPSRCEGTVEVNVRGEWRRARTKDLEASGAVCQSLDCGFPVSTEERREGNFTDVWEVRGDCVNHAAVRDCVWDGSSGLRYSLQLLCSDSVRLVRGQSLCSGSLQIRDRSVSQSWTDVCEGALGRGGAEVLCRELGCGPPLLQGALSPLGQTFHCEGHESALMDCSQNKTHTETCSALQLTCSDVRLVGGASGCEGKVELKHKAEWRRVDPSFGIWDLEAAGAVCRGLDCGSALSVEETERSPRMNLWSLSPLCVKEKKMSAIRDCVQEVSTNSNEALQLLCSDSVRLVRGRSLCSGSLQIRDRSVSQSWTEVCEGAVGRGGAEVLCRELGCGPPLLRGAHSPLRQTFHCEGHESALMDCPRNKTRPETCSALQLTCSEPVRLAGGPSRCEGTVEVQHRGEWRRAMTFNLWDLQAAAAVCRSLDCGPALSAQERKGLSRADVWHLRANCVRKLSAVRGCVLGQISDRDQGLDVACAGKL